MARATSVKALVTCMF